MGDSKIFLNSWQQVRPLRIPLFATIQMLDVYLPTTDGRWLIMPRYTQPAPEQMLLLHQQP